MYRVNAQPPDQLQLKGEVLEVVIEVADQIVVMAVGVVVIPMVMLRTRALAAISAVLERLPGKCFQ